MIYSSNEMLNGEFATTIDLSSQSKGVYLLKIKTDRGIINRKLVIE